MPLKLFKQSLSRCDKKNAHYSSNCFYSFSSIKTIYPMTFRETWYKSQVIFMSPDTNTMIFSENRCEVEYLHVLPRFHKHKSIRKLDKMNPRSKLLKTESIDRMIIMDGGRGGIRKLFNGHRFQFCNMENFWRSVLQQWEYTLYYWTVHLKTADAEAETPVLWPPHAKSWLIGKDPDAGRDWGQGEEGMQEDEMAGWHHQLDGHEFE